MLESQYYQQSLPSDSPILGAGNKASRIIYGFQSIVSVISSSTFSYIHRCVAGAYPISSLILLLRNRFCKGNDVSKLNQIYPGFHVKRITIWVNLDHWLTRKVVDCSFLGSIFKNTNWTRSTLFPWASSFLFPRALCDSWNLGTWGREPQSKIMLRAATTSASDSFHLDFLF